MHLHSGSELTAEARRSPEESGPPRHEPGGLVLSLKTRDFDEMAAILPRWNSRYQQLSRGTFAGELRFVQVGGIQIYRVAVNQVIQARGVQPPDSYVFIPVTPSQGPTTWRGRELRPGRVVVLGPGQDHDHRTAHTYESISMTVAGPLLRRSIALLQGIDLEDRLSHWHAFVTGESASASLQIRFARLLEQIAAEPELLGHPAAVAAVEEKCVRWLLQAVGPSEAVGKPEAGFPPVRVVRRAEDFMLAHLTEPLTILDVCAEAGVSERALHYAFQAVHGMSPKAYWKAKRLNELRRELRTVGPGAGVVSALAQRWGFWHTGNFAADYRRLFGELPSETLSRSRLVRPGMPC